MLKTLKRLKKEKKIHPPEWLLPNIVYVCKMGSQAYGTSMDDSDIDVYGYAVPQKELVFPHAHGYIHGFDEPHVFEQWQEHHVKDNDKEYDFTIFNMMKYMRLVIDCNPNMIDSLFVPRTCVLHTTQISELFRENRNLFLNKKAWHKYKGYAYNQISKMKSKNPEPGSKRFELVQKYGYDTKFASHAVRLLSQIEQIMTEGTLVLNQDGRRQQLKAIREGKWTEQQVLEYVNDKERQLEEVYLKCELPHSPAENMPRIKELIKTALQMWYDDTNKLISDSTESEAERKLKAIKEILES